MAKTQTKKAASKKGSDHIEDIPHEVVAGKTELTPAPAKVEDAEPIDDEKSLELTIQKEIKRFNLADAGIAQLKKDYGALVIKDVNDKDGYKAVKDAWNEVRSTRTALSKKGLEIRNGYNKITKAVSKEEDRLIDLLSPLEEDLQKKWKAIDDEKERVKKEKAEAEEKRLLDRLGSLTAKGMAVVDGYYSIGETVSVDVATVRTMTDEQFTKLEKAVDAKAAEIAQAKKEKEEADEKERKRLKDEQEKLDAQKKQQEDQQKLLDQQQADMKKALENMAKMKADMRRDKLSAIGMVHDKGAITFGKRYGITATEVNEMDDEAFEKFLVKSKETIAQHKKEDDDAEQKRLQMQKDLEDKKLRINEILIAAGFSYNFATKAFNFKNDFLNLSLDMDSLLSNDIEELKQNAIGWSKEIETARKKQDDRLEEQNKDREKQRQAQLGDAVNFGEYLDKVLSLEWPDLVSVEYQDKLGEFRTRLQSMVNEYMPEPEVAKP